MYLRVLTIDFIKMIDVYQPGHIRGVARGSWGARDPPPPSPPTLLGLLLSKQPKNIQVAKTPWQYLGRKSRCWKAHFFKICFFVKYFRQRLLSLVNMGLHAAIIQLRPLIHDVEVDMTICWVASVTPLWKILATPLHIQCIGKLGDTSYMLSRRVLRA